LGYTSFSQRPLEIFGSPKCKYMHACIDIYGLTQMVRVISISDEVYFELSRMKDGKSFTQLLKTLIEKCENKGDPRRILDFLNAHEALSEESACKITDELAESRKRTVARNILIE
jgi:predicted CopG family antitoxin